VPVVGPVRRAGDGERADHLEEGVLEGDAVGLQLLQLVHQALAVVRRADLERPRGDGGRLLHWGALGAARASAALATPSALPTGEVAGQAAEATTGSPAAGAHAATAATPGQDVAGIGRKGAGGGGRLIAEAGDGNRMARVHLGQGERGQGLQEHQQDGQPEDPRDVSHIDKGPQLLSAGPAYLFPVGGTNFLPGRHLPGAGGRLVRFEPWTLFRSYRTVRASP
jgi:hypothetical protein